MNPIAAELERRGLSQTELAGRAGISPQYLNDILHDRVGCGGQAALRLARALDGAVTTEEILLWSSKRKQRAERRRRKAKAA